MTTDSSPSGTPSSAATSSSLRATLIAIALILAILAALLVGILVTGRSATATPVAGATVTATPAGISVLGTSTVTGTPDVLTLSMSVAVTRPSASQALSAMNASAAKLQSALKSQGIDAKDLQTSNLSLYPNYGEKSVIDGYQASQSVNATLRDLATAGATIGKVTDALGNDARIEGLSFGLESDSALLKEARAKAIADAKVRAQTYAEAANRSVGDILSIAEPGVTFSVQPTYKAAEAASPTGAGSSVQLQPGSQEVEVSVTVTYALR